MIYIKSSNKFAWNRFGTAVPHFLYRCSLPVYMRYQNKLHKISVVDKFSYVFFDKDFL